MTTSIQVTSKNVEQIDQMLEDAKASGAPLDLEFIDLSHLSHDYVERLLRLQPNCKLSGRAAMQITDRHANAVANIVRDSNRRKTIIDVSSLVAGMLIDVIIQILV